jgi:excisionase family DNA binding protein
VDELNSRPKQYNLPENKPLLRAQEVADYLDISKAQVYHLTKIGQIPALHFGSVIRFRRVDVIDLVDGSGHVNNGERINEQ